MCWGKLCFLGHGARKPLRVVYEDGDTEYHYVKGLEKAGVKLQAKGAQLPAGVTIPVGEALQQLQQQLDEDIQSAGHRNRGRKGSVSRAVNQPTTSKTGRGRALGAVCKLAAGEVLTSGAVGQQLPEKLPLATAEQVGKAVQLLMPGPM